MKQNIIGVSSFSFFLLTWNNFNLEKVERLFFTFIVLERSSKETRGITYLTIYVSKLHGFFSPRVSYFTNVSYSFHHVQLRVYLFLPREK